MDFFFSLHHNFLALGIASLFCILYDADCLLFSSSNLAFSNVFAD